MDTKNIKNLLFDLGGVLYSIDIQKMFVAFKPLQIEGKEVYYTKNKQHPIFAQMDKGEVDGTAFAQGLREAYDLTGNDEQILDAWNALLVGVIDGREQAIQTLAERYDLALLSNTNRVHRDVFLTQCETLFSPMKHCFYSDQMGMRKPDANIYQTALAEMGWKAEETLFIDDTEVNITAANALGLHTFYMEKESDFEELMTILTTEHTTVK